MDEKYIQELYSQLGGQNKFGDFNSFKNLIKTDKNYQKAFHDSFGAKTLGDFNQFSGLVSSSNQKKKDLSQPTSQEDQSVSNTQPKPQPTSSATGQQQNQQASATSDGEPKIGTFTGFTPEQQKTMQEKPAPDYMVAAKKPSESLNLTDKRLKVQKQIKDLESSQGTLTRETQNLISQKNKELLGISESEKALNKKNTASIESQIDNVDQTKIDQQMADEFDQNQITDYIREGAKQVAGAIVNPLWKGAIGGRYELPTELIDTKERNVFKDKVDEIKKLDKYKDLSDQDVYNEAVSLVREDFIGAEKNRRAADVLGDLDQSQLIDLKLNGIEKSKSLSAEQKGVISRIKLLDAKHTDIQKNYTGSDKQQKLDEIKQEYLKLVSESNRLGDSLKSNEDKVRMYGMSYSPMENFINLSGSTLLGFAGGGLNLVGSIDETLSSGLNKMGLGFLTGTKPGEKSIFKEMAQPILETEREVSEYTRHITLDDIANSDNPILDTGKYIAQTISGLIPYALTLGMGAEAQAAEGVVTAAGYNAGKGVIVASSMGKKAHEMEQEMIDNPKEVKYTTAQRIIAPILYGATDYMMLGGYDSMLKGMRGAIQSIEKNDASKSALDTGIKAFYKSTIGGLKTTASDVNKMGAIMAATEATKMFTDENILGKPSTDFSKRIVSAYLDGVAMDLIVKGAPKLGGYLLNKYSTNKYNLEIKNNLKMIEELDKKILNSELTVEDVNILKNSKKEYEDKNIALLDKNIASFKRLTSNQRKEILDIESEKSELREKAKYINSPESKLSVEDKKSQLDGLKKKYIELDNNKSKIIDNENNIPDVTPPPLVIEEKNGTFYVTNKEGITKGYKTKEEAEFSIKSSGTPDQISKPIELSIESKPKDTTKQGTQEEVSQPLRDVDSITTALESIPIEERNIPLSPLDLNNEGIITWKQNEPKSIAEAYNKSKANGSNPELVKAVEELFTTKSDVKSNDLVKEYIDSIEKVKSESPDVFWSVDRPFQNEDGTINEVELKKAAEEGRLIKTEAGFGVVGKDGDIKGVFKADLKSTEKTGDKVIQEAVKAGGTKLDNFALPNLMKRSI